MRACRRARGWLLAKEDEDELARVLGEMEVIITLTMTETVCLWRIASAFGGKGFNFMLWGLVEAG